MAAHRQTPSGAVRLILQCILFAAIVAPGLAGCGARAGQSSAPTPTLEPAATLPAAPTTGSLPITPTPANESLDDSGWTTGSDGIELREIRAPSEGNRPPATLIVVRLDPAAVRLRVAYAPDKPRGIRAWFHDRRPLLAVNGGFFNEQYLSTALVVSDGQASGTSYVDFGGMLAVAPDGSVTIRSLRDQPYEPGEALAQAMQSFPMLVLPGGTPVQIDENGERARRTAIAQDRAGRLLLIVSPGSSLTLNEFAQWLAGNDLNIDRALNLDGGSSTGMYLDAGAAHEAIDSFGPLPLVLLVERKD